jgi:hypothetical protein
MSRPESPQTGVSPRNPASRARNPERHEERRVVDLTSHLSTMGAAGKPDNAGIEPDERVHGEGID